VKLTWGTGIVKFTGGTGIDGTKITPEAALA
jgi:molybdopterin biosynthesis enzyme MoaB